MLTPCARCGIIPADPSGLHACIYSLTYETLSRLMALDTVASAPQNAMARWRERAERAEAELQRLRAQVANLDSQLNRANFELLSRMHRMGRANGNGTLDQNMLTKILSLVHPDRHANSEVS